MKRSIFNRLPRLTLFVSITLIGCDERVSQVAREAANRQADQNSMMADLQKDVSGGTRSLIQTEGRARESILKVHHQLQAERRRLDDRWNDLEVERKRIDKTRKIESLVAPTISWIGGSVLLTALLRFLVILIASRSPTNSSALGDKGLILGSIEPTPDDVPLIAEPEITRLVAPSDSQKDRLDS